MKILAIESSCDETSAAVIEEKSSRPLVLSNVVSSQIDLHSEYGGVVPEVAARAHIEAIIPVIEKALTESGCKLDDITHFAVTQGPGLVGSLVVGIETGKALSLTTGKPIIFVNHLEGHIYANFLSKNPNSKFQIPEFPLVALLVSGGHTLLILMREHLDYQIVGATKDDAAGEAFDKGAKVMGLGYPGGPIISALADKGNENKVPFPLIDLTKAPKRDSEGFLRQSEPSMDFSFSGLKTALINNVRGEENYKKADLAASFQKAIIASLMQNSLRAVQAYSPKNFIISGGVAANKKLRNELIAAIRKESPKIKVIVPDFSLCTDNAAMIGAAAYYQIKLGKFKTELSFSAEPNLTL